MWRLRHCIVRHPCSAKHDIPDPRTHLALSSDRGFTSRSAASSAASDSLQPARQLAAADTASRPAAAAARAAARTASGVLPAAAAVIPPLAAVKSPRSGAVAASTAALQCALLMSNFTPAGPLRPRAVAACRTHEAAALCTSATTRSRSEADAIRLLAAIGDRGGGYKEITIW